MQKGRRRAWPAGQWWLRAREGRAAVLWFQVDIVRGRGDDVDYGAAMSSGFP